MRPTRLQRTLLHVLLAAVFCVQAGCKPAASPLPAQEQTPGGSHRTPSTIELASFVRGKLPPSIKLVELKNDLPAPMPGTAPGGNVWSINVRLTFAPTEDVLGSPPPQAVKAFHATVDELSYLAAWSQAYARSPYAGIYPGFRVDPPTPTDPQLLMITQPKDRPFAPVYGKLAAEWQVDHWQYEFIDLALPQDNGRVRSAYTGPVMVQGDPATERFVMVAKAAVAANEPKKEVIEQRYREDLRKATQPGTVYKGQVSEGKITTPVEICFSAPSGDPDLVRFEMRLPTSGYAYTCSAKMAGCVPNMPVRVPRNDNPIFRIVAPGPTDDLTVNYESVNKPKLNLADTLANNLLYGHATDHNVPLALRNQQIQGKVAMLQTAIPIVLSAQPSP